MEPTGRGDEPQVRTTVTNKALPTAVDSLDEPTDGDLVSTPYNIEPNAITVKATKNMFADSAGDWTTNGILVAGQDSGITMTLNAKNTSASPVTPSRRQSYTPRRCEGSTSTRS